MSKTAAHEIGGLGLKGPVARELTLYFSKKVRTSQSLDLKGHLTRELWLYFYKKRVKTRDFVSPPIIFRRLFDWKHVKRPKSKKNSKASCFTVNRENGHLQTLAEEVAP